MPFPDYKSPSAMEFVHSLTCLCESVYSLHVFLHVNYNQTELFLHEVIERK